MPLDFLLYLLTFESYNYYLLESVCVHASCFSSVRFFVIPWTIACQAPLSMGFSRQNTRVGCHALLQGIFLT